MQGKEDLSYLEIKKSKIAGSGVFAKKNIKKGSLIIILKGKICSSEEISKRIKNKIERPADPLQIDASTYLDLNEISRTFNHSCDPNAFIRGKNELVALRDIKKDEEITYDYSTTADEDEEELKNEHEIWYCYFSCSCGSKSCRHIIKQFKDLPPKLKNFYLKNKFAPNFILNKYKK